tara:strand:+ start:491 stop:730 length:240 start_codon:yes stop_codon:yes gene_type:complete
MKEPIVHFKRYISTHPSAMLSGNKYFEITKIEGAVFFEVTKEENSKSLKYVSVGDRLTMDQAYQCSIDAHAIVEPVYPN